MTINRRPLTSRQKHSNRFHGLFTVFAPFSLGYPPFFTVFTVFRKPLRRRIPNRIIAGLCLILCVQSIALAADSPHLKIAPDGETLPAVTAPPDSVFDKLRESDRD